MLGADDLGQHPRCNDAILGRDDEGVGSHESRQVGTSGIGYLEGLGTHEHDIDLSDLGSVVSGGNVEGHLGVSDDAQSVLANGFQGLATGDEGDVGPGVGQHATVESADGSGADHSCSHRSASFLTVAQAATIACSTDSRASGRVAGSSGTFIAANVRCIPIPA